MNLPTDQDPSATTQQTLSVVVDPPLPNMQVAPNPLSLFVAAGQSTTVPVTITNSATLATLQGISATFSTGPAGSGAQLIPWLSLNAASSISGSMTLPDLPPGGSVAVTVTASPPITIAPGAYQTYLSVMSANGGTQYIPLTAIIDSNQHGTVQIIVSDGNSGQPLPNATVQLTEQAPPYTRVNVATDVNGVASMRGGVGIPYQYHVTAAGYNGSNGYVTLTSPLTTTQLVGLTLLPPQAQWKVTPITITDSYQTNLQVTYETDLPTPSLVMVPQYFQFDAAHPHQSGTLTVYNPSRIRVDNVTVDSGNIPGVSFTLSYTYTDPTTGEPVTLSGSSLTIPEIAARSQIAVQYVADASCPPGSAPQSGSLTASGSYQYFPNVPAMALDVAHGRGLQGSTTGDMTLGRQLQNTGYSSMSGIAMGVTGTLGVDLPTTTKTLLDLSPSESEPSPFTLHTQGLNTGQYTATVTMQAGNGTPTSTLLFTATVDGGGRVSLDYDFVPGQRQPATAAVTTKSTVIDASCAVPPPPPPAPPTVSFGGGFVITYGGGGSGGGVPALPNIPVPPPPAPTAHEVVQLTIPQTTTLERQAFDANLQLTNVTQDALNGVTVTLNVVDASGNARGADGALYADEFAITPPTTSGYAAGANLGTIEGGTRVDNDWTLIPSPGLGGQAGQQYQVSATYQYVVNGGSVIETTNPVTITVDPLPQLQVRYTIPRNVTAYQPFKLGVIVKNVGYGTAHNLRIESGQPVITDNVSGALLSFSLTGAQVSGSTIPLATGALTLPFGDIAPGQTTAGYWTVVTDSSGTFTGFDATYQEQLYDGVALSPLIQSERTYIVTHDNVAVCAGGQVGSSPAYDEIASGNVNNPTGNPSLSDSIVDLIDGSDTGVVTTTATVSQSATAANPTTIAAIPAITGTFAVLVIVPDTLPPSGTPGGAVAQVVAQDGDGSSMRLLPLHAVFQQGGFVYILDHPTGVATTYDITYTATSSANARALVRLRTSADTEVCGNKPQTQPKLSASPATLPADGHSVSTIKLQGAAANDRIQFISDRADVDTFSPQTGTTNSNGQLVTTLTSHQPGNANITAQDLTSGDTLDASVAVTFTDPNAAPTPAPTATPTGVYISGIDPDPKYPFGAGFLSGIKVNNHIIVHVNWQGATPDHIDASINGTMKTISKVDGNGGSIDLDMGSDLRPGPDVLHFVAYGRRDGTLAPSQPVDKQYCQASTPDWLHGMIKNGAVDALAVAVNQNQYLTKKLEAKQETTIPKTPLGDLVVGFDESASAGVTIAAPPRANFSLDAGVTAKGKIASIDLKGEGKASVSLVALIPCQPPIPAAKGSLDTTFGLTASRTYSIAEIVSVFGGLEAAAVVDKIPSNIQDLLGTVKPYLGVDIGLEADANSTPDAPPGAPYYEFGGGSGQAGVTLGIIVQVGPDDFNTTLTGSATGALHLVLPDGRRDLHDLQFSGKVAADLNATVTVPIFGTQQLFDAPFTLFNSDPASSQSSSPRAYRSQKMTRHIMVWTLVAHDRRHGHALWRALPAQAQAFAFHVHQAHRSTQIRQSAAATSAASVAATTTMTSVLESQTYTYTVPSLAVDPHSGDALVAYVHDNPAKPVGQSHEVYYSHYHAATGTWTSPANIITSADLQQNELPQVAWTHDGSAIATWLRLDQDGPLTPTLTADQVTALATHVQIATAAYSSTTDRWTPPQFLTTNPAYHSVPRLAAGPSGHVMAVWKENASGHLSGDATHPDTITAALYDDHGWSVPGVAVSGVPGLVELAVGLGRRSATIAYTAPITPTGSTTSTLQLFTSTENTATGVWSMPLQQTSDSSDNYQPQVVYTAADEPLIVWLQGGVAHVRNLSSGIESTATVPLTQGSAIGLRAALAPDGGLVLTLIVQNGSAQTLYTMRGVFDLARTMYVFGTPTMLTDQNSITTHPSTALDGAGRLLAVYDLSQLIPVSQTITDPNTGATSSGIVPVPNTPDLVSLAHVFTSSLTMTDTDLTLSDPQASPGQSVVLSATVHNTGDEPLDGVTVRFYDGNPSNGGTLLATVPTSATLLAQQNTVLTTTITVPGDGIAHVFYAVATTTDPTAIANGAIAHLLAFGPDLRVAAGAITPTGPTEAQVNVVVSNVGQATSEPTTLALYRDAITGTLLITTSVPTLAPSQVFTPTLSISYAGLTAGQYTIVAVVNQDGHDFPETMPLNNTDHTTLTVGPDLEIGDTPLSAQVSLDGRLSVSALIRNVGATASRPVSATLYADVPYSDTTAIVSGTVPALQPGANSTLTLIGAPTTPLTPGVHALYVVVDPQVTEIDETLGDKVASALVTVVSPANPTPTISPTCIATTTATPTPTNTSTSTSTAAQSSTPTPTPITTGIPPTAVPTATDTGPVPTPTRTLQTGTPPDGTTTPPPTTATSTATPTSSSTPTPT